MSKSLKGTAKVTSVWLSAEKNGRGYKVEMFKCFKCSIPVIQYEGDIIRLVPGNSPYLPKTILKCKGSYKNDQGEWEECSMRYEFMGTSQFMPSDTI